MAQPLIGTNSRSPRTTELETLRRTRHERAHRLRDNHLTPIPIWIVRGLLTGLLELLPHRLTNKERDILRHNLLIAACDTIVDDDGLVTHFANNQTDNAQVLLECYRIVHEYVLAQTPQFLLRKLTKPSTHNAYTVVTQAALLGPIVKKFPSKRRNDDHAVLWVQDRWPEIASVLTHSRFGTLNYSCSVKCLRTAAIPDSIVLRGLGACTSPHKFRNALLAYHHNTNPAEIKQLLASRALNREVQKSVKLFELFQRESLCP